MDISKTQYNDSLQVRVTRKTGSLMERDNFSAMYLLNGDSRLEFKTLNWFTFLKHQKTNET